MTWGAETTADEVIAGIDLSGRLAVVTGASSGLGLETARVLASAGARVLLAVRDPAKGDEAAATIRERVPGASVEPVVLDLGSLRSVRACADSLTRKHEALHLLVNNAGVMATPLGRTTDGFEVQFGTNHLGHFLLTCLLAPVLLAGASARVVNVSSAGHTASGILWDDPNYERRPYDPWEAYGQSKTANILFAVGLERRLGPRGVHAYAVHPGMTPTNIGRHLTREDVKALAKRAPSGKLPPLKPVEAGAATIVYAAAAPELDGRGGLYLEDCAPSDGHAPWARDEADAERLWTLSEELVGERFEP